LENPNNLTDGPCANCVDEQAGWALLKVAEISCGNRSAVFLAQETRSTKYIYDKGFERMFEMFSVSAASWAAMFGIAMGLALVTVQDGDQQGLRKSPVIEAAERCHARGQNCLTTCCHSNIRRLGKIVAKVALVVCFSILLGMLVLSMISLVRFWTEIDRYFALVDSIPELGKTCTFGLKLNALMYKDAMSLLFVSLSTVFDAVLAVSIAVMMLGMCCGAMVYCTCCSVAVSCQRFWTIICKCKCACWCKCCDPALCLFKWGCCLVDCRCSTALAAFLGFLMLLGYFFLALFLFLGLILPVLFVGLVAAVFASGVAIALLVMVYAICSGIRILLCLAPQSPGDFWVDAEACMQKKYEAIGEAEEKFEEDDSATTTVHKSVGAIHKKGKLMLGALVVVMVFVFIMSQGVTFVLAIHGMAEEKPRLMVNEDGAEPADADAMSAANKQRFEHTAEGIVAFLHTIYVDSWSRLAPLFVAAGEIARGALTVDWYSKMFSTLVDFKLSADAFCQAVLTSRFWFGLALGVSVTLAEMLAVVDDKLALIALGGSSSSAGGTTTVTNVIHNRQDVESGMAKGMEMVGSSSAAQRYLEQNARSPTKQQMGRHDF
jgi:hypothetical protein